MKIKNLLLKNKSLKQTLFKNTVWLSVSKVITHILTAILGIFIARTLGATNYGLLGFAISFTGLFSILSELGLHFIIIREINQNQNAKNDLGTLLSLKLFLGFLAFFIIIGCSFFIKNIEVRPLIIIFAAVTSLGSITLFFTAIFRALQKMEYVALTELVQAIMLFIGGFLIIVLNPIVTLVAYAYLLSSLLSVLVVVIVAKRLSILPRLTLNLKVAKKYLSLSWPLALSTVFTTIYVQIDSVMMGFRGMITEVGWYQACNKIMNIVIIPGGIIKTVFFPAISLAYKEKKGYFQKNINIFFNTLMFLALPISIGGFLLSHDIILFIYGKNFLPSALSLKILIISIIPILFIMLTDSIFIAIRRQKIIIYTTGLTALLNIILNFILIPRYSLYGAAVATTISYIFYFLLSLIILKKINIKLNIQPLAIILIATLIMAIFILSGITQNINIILQIIIAGFIYILTFGLSKFIFNYTKIKY